MPHLIETRRAKNIKGAKNVKDTREGAERNGYNIRLMIHGSSMHQRAGEDGLF